jgi:acetylornithine deacetylase/succinyl-diaminopimelate desuccinylase-like protein
VQFNDANRAYFTGMAKIQAARGQTEVAQAMTAFLHDPADAQALALVTGKDPSWNATLRTTCVATLLNAGHSPNALPQRAQANVNCRIFPGTSVETVRAKLEQLVADPKVAVSVADAPSQTPPPPPLTREILKPIEKLTTEFWPGVPVLPIMQPWATDGIYTNAAGIPTYGVAPVFVGPDLGNVHGLNEYIGVKSLLEGREFLYRLVRIYADQ